MFDIAPTELMLVAIVALIIIGPKDLPKAMRFVGHWVGKARSVARQFRSGFDAMVREAELAEMEKKWAEENARIMREHPPTGALPAPVPAPAAVDTPPPASPAPETPAENDAPPVMVEQPVTRPDGDPAPGPSDSGDKSAS
ncbi:Sec-independent protein translocase protein TatB [Sphingosinithalassobacter sp. CS137]|uniref:Sec-independent protein translocase protein TatB n=1 Tax=Sphingosinithalassobacter sp. CS137 TaxID=2762748 RepID=UPI00165E86EB|nr:Sec-independent protein translocase protein TatB [Sphingosinithalassobacter sp. CS137]